MDSKIEIVGHVEQYLDGVLIDKCHNTIHDDLKRSFGNLLNTSVRSLMDPTDYISVQNARGTGSNGSAAGSDGIALRDTNYNVNNYFSMETTEENTSYNGNGIQWKGIQVANEARTVDQLVLGTHFWSGEVMNDAFMAEKLAYINQSSPIIIENGQLYEVTWGIYIL